MGYFERGAYAGHPHAAWKAGMYYLSGRAGPRDEKRAAELVLKAAEGGDLSGFLSRAVMLATGEGVAEDDPAARTWYERAVERGSSQGLRGLGGMLLTGEGGPTDRIRGFAYLELAAEAGDEVAVGAMQTLGADIEAGERAAIDRLKAEWVREHGAPTANDG